MDNHIINFADSFNNYKQCVSNRDLLYLLDALKSKVPIKRVECSRLRNPTLRGLLALYEILCINKSVIDLKISSHIIDVVNGVFCLSATHYSAHVSPGDVKSFQRLCIKELSLKGCSFTDAGVSALCDLFKFSSSLTVIDLSECNICDDVLLKIISALQYNPNLKKVSLNNSSITFNSLLKILDLRSSEKLPEYFETHPHSIDLRHGVFCFVPQCRTELTSDQLSSLQSYLKKFIIKEFTLKKCRFSDYIILYEIIRCNFKFLTFIDFSYCGLNDHNLMEILNKLQLQSNSNLTEIHLGLNSIGAEGAFALTEALTVDASVSKVCLACNSIGAEGAIV
ncbi:hypothetical protein GEMRC1_010075 [Eukaryota sp. GEM-RC1]